jgi:hypothetical protein
MKIRAGEHMTVIGQTGAGKTLGVKWTYLPIFERGIILDAKEEDFNEFPVVSVKRAIELSRSNYRFFVRIVMTGVPEVDEETVDSLSAGLLKLKPHSGDLVLYLDEATDYADANSVPRSLRSLIRKARSKGITIIVGTQRYQMLSKDYYTNSIHHVWFYMDEDDARKMRDHASKVADRIDDIPKGSWRSLYVGPSNEVILLGPAVPYDWAGRLKKK